MRSYVTRGRFGIVLGVGAAAAITQAYADRPVVAVVLAVVTAVLALVVFLAVDRRKA